MLTIFYVSATFLQSWRIKKVCNLIAEQLTQKSSVAFYTLPAATEDGFDAALATSDLCVNRAAAKVSEILWLHGDQRGCCLRPMQTLQITPWISFPDAPNWLPFAFRPSSDSLLERLSSGRDCNLMYLLLETDIQPCYRDGRNLDVVRIEDYGKLIAWKIDSHIAVLIKTDVEHFTKLLIATYLQNNFLINDQLALLRIESVTYESKPQPFEQLASHLRKSKRTSARQLNDEEWQKHLDDLRSLSVLANQATEFEYNKNRTEGKTGVVKPDLIPPEKQIDSSANEQNTTTMETAEKTNTNIDSGTAVDALVTSSPTSFATILTKPAKTSTTDFGKPTALETTNLTEKATSSTTNLIKAEIASTTLADTAVASGAKMRAKPTEIKKPGASLSESRFKTTKVTESPVKTVSSSQASTPSTATPGSTASQKMKTSPAKMANKTSSELERVVAAAVAPKQKSPLHTSSAAGSVKTSATVVTATAVKSSSVQEEKPMSSVKTVASNKTSSSAAVSAVATAANNTKRPSLRRHKDSLIESKPLNILIYSDSTSAKESAMTTLKDILEKDMYTVYAMSLEQVEQKHWFENTALVVVCGTVAPNIGEILVHYFLCGGKVLSLCSDILHFILPTYRTAEVREHELVQFSYDKWQKVKMMHHIFCYQPSPVKKNFSTDSDDSTQKMASVRKSALVCPPRSIELKDLDGEIHNLDVKVLGTEETWNTPSLLLANSVKSGGKAVFSQVHLESNPSQFEADEMKYSILKQNEKIRMEIFTDLLSKHLNVHVRQSNVLPESTNKCTYQNAYFLGHHESKFELIQKLKERSGNADNVITTTKLTMKFCGKDDKLPHANTNILPILIHSCPEDFSTVNYFENLKTNYIGRLVIYAPVVNSSMNVINELELTNGIAVLPRQQTEGTGRSNNQWLSPIGCAMFSIQLHISLDSKLGSRLPLLQHIIGIAIVHAIKGHDLYKNLDIGLKWPNDIYANGINKIGGLVVKTTLCGRNAIVNFGAGINLDNSKPTVCLNDLINDYNRTNQKKLPILKYEQFTAMIFNEIENLVEQVQKDDFDNFYKLYYNYWLHSEQSVTIADKDGKSKEAKITGIDDFGYLKVKILATGIIETVQPDGNSFDMLKGLIVPKFN